MLNIEFWHIDRSPAVNLQLLPTSPSPERQILGWSGVSVGEITPAFPGRSESQLPCCLSMTTIAHSQSPHCHKKHILSEDEIFASYWGRMAIRAHEDIRIQSVGLGSADSREKRGATVLWLTAFSVFPPSGSGNEQIASSVSRWMK